MITKTQKIEILIKYLRVKIQERDWHGVSDCANDLRVLEAAPALSSEEIRQALLAREPDLTVDDFKNPL